MKKLTIVCSSLALAAMSSVAHAAYMPYSCTWIEKVGTVLSSMPKDCIAKGQHFKNFDDADALEQRVEAAQPRACMKGHEVNLGKSIENAAVLSDGKDIFTVVQHCKDVF